MRLKGISTVAFCLMLCGLAATVGVGTSRAAGFSPGFAPNGVLAPSGQVRYLAVSTAHTTRDVERTLAAADAAMAHLVALAQ